MRQHEWRALIIRAAAEPDGDLLTSLANHLAACENAKAVLVAKGYGQPDAPVDVLARLVPKIAE